MENNVILLDNENLTLTIKNMLENNYIHARPVKSPEEALSLFKTGNYHAIAANESLVSCKFIEQLQKESTNFPIIIFTGKNSSADDFDIIRAMQRKIFDYFPNPFVDSSVTAEFIRSLNDAACIYKSGPNAAISVETEDFRHDSIVGRSKPMLEVYKSIGRVASVDISVLITGETGVGKELVARALYNYSTRAGKPFVVVNCAALPETLIESEMFGHVKGAYTGASFSREGRFKMADKGIVFLDEIGEMSLSTQSKLLRFLQNKTFEPLGSNNSSTVDVRVISATNKNLNEALNSGSFREDLYHRINQFSIHIPPLRERRDDIPKLINYFIFKISERLKRESITIHEDAIQYLQEMNWPGNVRQLENILTQAIISSNGYPITLPLLKKISCDTMDKISPSAYTLEQFVSSAVLSARHTKNSYKRLIEPIEHFYFSKLYSEAEGDLSRMARWAGISRPTLSKKLTIYNIHKPKKQWHEKLAEI